MLNYTDSINSQKPFLTSNQPTVETVNVLLTLDDFFSGMSEQANPDKSDDLTRHQDFKYGRELRNCNLDYSINSLKRVDEWLLTVKNRLPDFTEHRIFSSEYPLHNSSTIEILSYYLGEVIGRARREAPVWYSDASDHCIGEQAALTENMFVEFDSDIQDLCDFFVPKQVIYQALIIASDDGVLQDQTIWQSVLELVPSTILSNTDFNQPLPPVPIMELKFDRKIEFANLDRADLAYLQMMPPKWMKDDVLYEQINQLAKLYKTGKVVWAHVVQANKMLWSSDQAYSCPAGIVYDPTGRTPVSYLAEIAHKLYTFKNTIPDTDDIEILKYAEHITDEHTRMLGFDIPSSITPLPLKSTSLFVWRLHLPNGILQSSFPILISDETAEVTVLPAKFWEQAYYDEWIQDSYFEEDMYYGVRKLYESDNPWKKYEKHLRPQVTELTDDIPSLASEVSFNSHKPTSTDIAFVATSIQQNFAEARQESTSFMKTVIAVILFIAVLYGFKFFI
ncbi:hypothetical protein IOD06_03365 [Psychrobacter sp. N25K4-3-2]|uniref:hypothetical protein n=1 Tax=Psychrobacter sp. N25K4-3-2 TaxID=2785026 RepID=UPI00188C7542|nr:hypothetical protein [Psychrobacter sp. N25K4-3-2]MBF4488920.1 hypothetical protein [Psychrobacter sp. N25K4-3-2]